MADERFRSYRTRGPSARDQIHSAESEVVDDPLAELARLIGQGDPYAEAPGRDARSSGRGEENVRAASDWATNDGDDAQDDRGEDLYAHSPPSLPPASYGAFAPAAAGLEDVPPAAGRQAYPPGPRFDGSRETADGEVDDQYGREPDRPGQNGEDAPYGATDQYDDDTPAPGRRPGLVVVMAVLGLVVIGVAGAFGYRAMFGSSMLPMLPPIIKASGGPNKILPSHLDSQADASLPSGTGSGSSTEKVVSREEQPVDMEAPKTNSRVVSTTPVPPAQNPSASQPAFAPAPAVPAAAGLPVASAAAAPWPTGSSGPTTASVPSGVPAAAPVPSEPRKVHTVTIRADQPAAADAPSPAEPPLPVPAPSTHHSPHPASSANKANASANAPLSIIPGAEAAAGAPTHTRPATAQMPSATNAAASGGRYAVQVTSQRSEADAQASFKALQAKFPNQLGGREPMIRRADLGSKGVYYRALVGPFASMEQAAGMCSSLKAAGGNCLVQRN